MTRKIAIGLAATVIATAGSTLSESAMHGGGGGFGRPAFTGYGRLDRFGHRKRHFYRHRYAYGYNYAPLYGHSGAYDSRPWNYRGGPHPR
jgi:hypothetical protein